MLTPTAGQLPGRFRSPNASPGAVSACQPRITSRPQPFERYNMLSNWKIISFSDWCVSQHVALHIKNDGMALSLARSTGGRPKLWDPSRKPMPSLIEHRETKANSVNRASQDLGTSQATNNSGPSSTNLGDHELLERAGDALSPSDYWRCVNVRSELEFLLCDNNTIRIIGYSLSCSRILTLNSAMGRSPVAHVSVTTQVENPVLRLYQTNCKIWTSH